MDLFCWFFLLDSRLNFNFFTNFGGIRFFASTGSSASQTVGSARGNLFKTVGAQFIR